MEQIRVSRGIEVCVNDNEETININIDDTLWIDRFVKWLEEVNSLATDEKVNGLDGIVNTMTKATEGMNNLFGERASDKVFGDGVLPTPLGITEFVNQVIPIISKYADMRQKKLMDRYSKNRKGGKK